MKRIITIFACALVLGLVGCSAQKKPALSAKRDYKAVGADESPQYEGGKFGKFGAESRTGDTYK